jgi:hypothetical protein
LQAVVLSVSVTIDGLPAARGAGHLWHTDRGLQIGSPFTDLVAAYGDVEVTPNLAGRGATVAPDPAPDRGRTHLWIRLDPRQEVSGFYVALHEHGYEPDGCPL